MLNDFLACYEVLIFFYDRLSYPLIICEWFMYMYQETPDMDVSKYEKVC